MGCDGGTIPKRKEIVKNKERQPRQQRDRSAKAAEEWKNCAICDWILTKPIVAGHWGHIYCKECVLRHLLDYGRGALSAYHLVEDKAPKLNSLHAMKDVKELTLKQNTLAEGSSQSSNSEEDAIKADFVCPITGLETNGKYKFVFSWNCGCVVSERAIKEIPNEDKCLVCQKPYKKFDLITLNPDKKDLEENQAKFLVRKINDHMSKEESAADLESSRSSRHAGGWEDWGLDDGDRGRDDGDWGRGCPDDDDDDDDGGFEYRNRSDYELLRRKRQQRQQERQRLQRSRPRAGPIADDEPSTSSGIRPSTSRGSRPLTSSGIRPSTSASSKTSRRGGTSGGHSSRRAHDDDDVSSSTEKSQSKKQRP